MVIALALPLTIQASPSPYVQYVETARSLARMTYAAGLCSRLNYDVDKTAGENAVLTFIDRAAIDRVGSDHAGLLYQQALEAEQVEVDRLIKAPPGETQSREDERLRAAADFFVARCQEATTDYPAVVIADGNEDKSGADLIRRVETESASQVQMPRAAD